MQLQETKVNAHLVQHYDQTHGLQVGDQYYFNNVLLYPSSGVVNWDGDLASIDVQNLHHDGVELFIIGTAQTLLQPLAAEQVARFNQSQVGIELMNIEAACRTYNLLVAEGRHVVLGMKIS